MVLKHGSEAKLLHASKQYDAALKEQELDKLDSLVDTNYIIHADGITLKVVACSLFAGVAVLTQHFAALQWSKHLRCNKLDVALEQHAAQIQRQVMNMLCGHGSHPVILCLYSMHSSYCTCFRLAG